MFQYSCLNPIAQIGLDGFDGQYEKTDDVNAADVVLVRSAAMHDMELSDKLCAIARAGAGVNNIPLDKCADQGIVVFNTPGANANGVKEMVVSVWLPEILQVECSGLRTTLTMKIFPNPWKRQRRILPVQS